MPAAGPDQSRRDVDSLLGFLRVFRYVAASSAIAMINVVTVVLLARANKWNTMFGDWFLETLEKHGNFLWKLSKRKEANILNDKSIGFIRS